MGFRSSRNPFSIENGRALRYNIRNPNITLTRYSFMFTTDAHCDTLFEMTLKGRKCADCQITPQRLRAGNISLQTFALFTGYRTGHPY